jgi:hypothetical protein
MRHPIKIVVVGGVVAVGLFATAAAAGAMLPGPSRPTATPTPSDSVPTVQGTVVSLKLYEEHRGKPSWVCSTPAGASRSEPCQKIVTLWPLRAEACIQDGHGETICWYLDPVDFRRLHQRRPVPSNMSDVFSDPHAKPSAGPPNGFEVLATKPSTRKS